MFGKGIKMLTNEYKALICPNRGQRASGVKYYTKLSVNSIWQHSRLTTEFVLCERIFHHFHPNYGWQRCQPSRDFLLEYYPNLGQYQHGE